MKKINLIHLVICILYVSAIASGPLFSSAGRPPAPGGAATPKATNRTMMNVNRPVVNGIGTNGAIELKEGDRIKVTGKLVTLNGRPALKSEESGREYIILENSSLEKIQKTEFDSPGKIFIATARVTSYKNEFYIFIVEFESGD